MSSERPPLASVATVREELKRLGYLDRGLDRFVLAGALGRSPMRASFAAAWRVALAGGLLFGLAGALAAVGLDGRLLGEPRDLAVLSLYLVTSAALVTGLLAFAGGLVAGWAGRGRASGAGNNLARIVGLALAVAALFYLSWWWRTHLLGAPRVAQAMALVLGIGLSLALGRFGSLAAVAVLAAGGHGDRLPVAALSRRHLLPVLGAAVLLYGGGVAAATYFTGSVAGPDFAVIPSGLRVRVLGIDGLERGMAESMIARGEMPQLQALLAAGARGSMKVEPERVPAIVWTTMATGRGPEAHGIQSLGARRLAGLRTPLVVEREPGPFLSALTAAADLLRLTHREPASSGLRSAKTFWNIAAEKGLRVGVVNWWATWPADALNGYLVSDRAFFKLEKGGPPDREVWPTEDFERLRPLVARAGAESDRAHRLDRFHTSAARLLRGDNPPDIEALYLSGLDIFTSQRLGEAAEADVASLGERLEAVRAYYRFVDGLIGEAAAGWGKGELLILVGDPGRRARSAATSALGTLVLVGGPVIAGDLGLVSSRDLAPTVLYLVGLPRSEELEGAVLEAALAPEFRASHPLRSVRSYGRRASGPTSESAFDQDVLEELKSLGYIQ
jgi:hypothetical protein